MIMANLPPKAGILAANIIYNCWQDNTINPWNDVVQAVARTVNILSNDCGKLTLLADALNDIARRWQQFQTTELVLYKALIDDCVQGIAARALDESVGKGRHTGKGSGVDMSDVLVAGAAISAGLVLADTDGSSVDNLGADSSTDSRGFFDSLGDFFGGLGEFLGDFFGGLGDFMGDSDGGFDFD
jgi:predicted nucleic acid-binding protein